LAAIGSILAEGEHVRAEPREAVQQGHQCRRQRYLMVPFRLAAGRRERPEPILEVELAPRHAADLVPTLAGEDPGFDQRPARIIEALGRRPDSPQFVLRQDAIAAHFEAAPLDGGGRVDIEVFPLDPPAKGGNELGTDPVHLRAQSLLVLEVVEELDQIGAPQLGQQPIADRRLHMALEQALNQPRPTLGDLAMPGNIVVHQRPDGPWAAFAHAPLVSLGFLSGRQVDAVRCRRGDGQRPCTGLGQRLGRIGAVGRPLAGAALGSIPDRPAAAPIDRHPELEPGRDRIGEDQAARGGRREDLQKPVGEAFFHRFRRVCGWDPDLWGPTGVPTCRISPRTSADAHERGCHVCA
jgi:hypothetical protein